ncbi:MAG: AMP-binding protein, partial [Acidimicrobiales bacterium]|nr:AMP-binding protein [Acidimicrobiales bacterium]
MPTIIEMGVAVQERIDAALLAAPSDAVALVDDRGPLRYGDLRELVAERAAGLDLGAPGIVVLQGPPSVDWVVTYLALLHDRHVPLLAGPNAGALVRTWSPLAAIEVVDGGAQVTHLGGPRPELHPDLALLLSTSGSTGSPKLVRLSHRNLVANARAIAEALGLGPADRGITSLPLQYCFGLSVLHSHLAVGASVAVTGASVVDPCFAAALRDHRVTNLAGVPHSFEMLEVAGPERLATGSLRLLCQAGGRLDAEARRRWRERAASWGAELAVMYGQTEATARMAVLPPA